ncbi:MAG: hypothetical protein LBL24_11760 [Bacteroidales bacterium]|jgi:hypothetical protein|nr:hypothetical protein [Bacteroidales bacterium]
MTQEEKMATPQQIKAIYTLLNKAGLMDRKNEIVCDMSEGRSMHCCDLTCEEASSLIGSLQDTIDLYEPQQAVQTDPKTSRLEMYNRIYGAARQCGFIYGDTEEDRLINLYLIEKFCLERGTVKKRLKDMTGPELKRTCRQFQAIVNRKNKTRKQ